VYNSVLAVQVSGAWAREMEVSLKWQFLTMSTSSSWAKSSIGFDEKFWCWAERLSVATLRQNCSDSSPSDYNELCMRSVKEESAMLLPTTSSPSVIWIMIFYKQDKLALHHESSKL